MTGLIDWIERVTPASPRVIRALDILLPLLVSALLITTLVGLGRVGNVADEAKTNSENNTRLLHTTAKLLHRTAGLAKALHDGLVESCQRNGNPLRQIVKERIQRELAQTSISRIQEFFPTLPRARLEALLEKSRAQNLKDIAALAPVPCKNQYR